MSTLDARFSRFLFATITRVSMEEGSDTMTFWFKRPGNGDDASHVVSADKLERENCYNKLKVGKSYVIDLDSYLVTKRKRHHIWVECVELPSRQMMQSFFDSYRRETQNGKSDDEALKSAGTLCGYKAFLQKQLQIKLAEAQKIASDLFEY